MNKMNKMKLVALKSAPWFFAAWLVAFFASCLYPPVNGFCRYLPLGPVQVDTWLTGVPACGLFLVWLQRKLAMTAAWYWVSVSLGMMAYTAMYVLENPNRAMRMVAFVFGQGV